MNKLCEQNVQSNILLFFMSFVFYLFPLSLEGEINLKEVEQLIFIKCNEKRNQYGLPQYKYNVVLAKVATYHSSNMIKYDFFSHTDHQRMSPQKRMMHLYPRIVGTVGENIAVNYGYSEEEIADNLVEAWMQSPGHRANILSSSYTTLGNGVVSYGDRSQANIDSYYATQNFGNLIAIYKGKFPIEGRYTSQIELPFSFIGGFPKNKLYIYISYPNRNYKHYVKSKQKRIYTYYTGGGPYLPIWQEEDDFYIQLSLDKGLGRYFIKMGSEGRFYQDGLTIDVKE